MSVEPVNALSLADYYLRVTLADGAGVQTWLGVDNRADALARMYSQALPAPAGNKAAHSRVELEALRPFVLTFTALTDGFVFERVAAPNSFSHTGVLVAQFESPMPDGISNDAEIDVWWLNTIGAIVADLQAGAGGEQHLNITAGELTLYGRPAPNEVKTLGDFLAARLQVRWRG